MIYAGRHAECHDLFYQGKPYPEEAQYAAGLVRARLPTARTVLDLGCGTGLRCLELARLGFQVCGIDQSEAMLAAARRHVAAAEQGANVKFEAGDIRNFRARTPVDAVISLFHVFCYLTTDRALKEAIECAFANLKPRGVLLFDYWHGPGVLMDPPSVRARAVENANLKVERTTVPQHLPNQHLVKLTVSLKATDKDDGASNESEEAYTMRYWFTNELEEALLSAGFGQVQHYAWMTESAPDPGSWQACTIAVSP